MVFYAKLNQEKQRVNVLTGNSFIPHHNVRNYLSKHSFMKKSWPLNTLINKINPKLRIKEKTIEFQRNKLQYLDLEIPNARATRNQLIFHPRSQAVWVTFQVYFASLMCLITLTWLFYYMFRLLFLICTYMVLTPFSNLIQLGISDILKRYF